MNYKKFFLHLLNTLSNLNYTSNHLPEKVYFGIDKMNEEKRSRFLIWYESESERLKSSGELYDMRHEMKRYCYDDCNVSATAFGRFNESMINELIRLNIRDIIPHQYTVLVDFVTLPQLAIHWYICTSMPL